MNRRLVLEAFYLFVKTYIDHIEFFLGFSEMQRLKKGGNG